MSRSDHQRRGAKALAVTLGTVTTALLVGMGAAFGYFLTTDSSHPAIATAASLSPPTNAHATATSTTIIKVTWTVPGTQLTGATYRVTRTAGPGSPMVVCTKPASTRTCTDTGLTPGSTYSYSVMAVLTGTNWHSSASTASVSTGKATVSFSSQTSTASLTVGNSVSDTVTVSGGSSPTGKITWHVYKSTTTLCTTPVVGYTSKQTVTGDSTYSSGSFTTTKVGTFKWGFTYSGDTHNNSAAVCGGTNESFTVIKATPTLSTSAGTSVTVGNAVHDTATLSNGYQLTGKLTFKLFKTSSCTTQVGSTVTTTVSGNNSYTSPTITPTAAGTYYWTATYTGDTNNNSKAETCGGSGESVTVTKATPAITTTTSTASVVAGGSVSDTAHVSAGYNITGTLTWHIYLSSTATCTTPQFSYTGSQTVSGNGAYSPTASATVTVTGSYKWGVSYAGTTGNNNPVTVCGGANESFTVSKASPTLTVAATATAKAGATIKPSGTLASGSNPTGTITWKVFGPQATPPATCTAGTTWTNNTATVSTGNGTYSPTTGVTLKVIGTYWWYATFTDTDGNNNNAASLCNTASMTKTVVSKATPTITVSAPAGHPVNVAIAKTTITATLTATSGSNAAGTITWKVFGPQATAPASCTGGTTWTGNTATVTGNGAYHPTNGFTPTVSGTYWWYASYGGDANNSTAASLCNSASMTKTIVSSTAGFGTMTITPTTVVASSKHKTFQFDFTAVGAVTNGKVTVTIPAGWTAPSTTSTAAGYVTFTPTTHSPPGTLSVSGSTITISNLNLASGASVSFLYGLVTPTAPATGVTIPATLKTYTFTTKEASTSVATPLTIATQPTVRVVAACIVITGSHSVAAGATVHFTLKGASGAKGGRLGGTGGGGTVITGTITNHKATAVTLSYTLGCKGIAGSIPSSGTGNVGYAAGGNGGSGHSTRSGGGGGGGGASAVSLKASSTTVIAVAAGGGGGGGQGSKDTHTSGTSSIATATTTTAFAGGAGVSPGNNGHGGAGGGGGGGGVHASAAGGATAGAGGNGGTNFKHATAAVTSVTVKITTLTAGTSGTTASITFS